MKKARPREAGRSEKPATMRRVAIVAAHFTPSNLTAVHRARLWAQHLSEFGWEPIIVTTHWRYYEESLDWDLNELVCGTLRVIRTRAIPTRPLRIVGDIGIRALFWHYRALAELARREEIDFVHITIPSHFSALLGRLVWGRHRIPYGLDYIDPWVESTGRQAPLLSKARLSGFLARVLEPWAIARAALITGVAASYYEGALERNPDVRKRAVTAAMPYGGAEADHEHLRRNPRPLFLFDDGDGLFHMLYAGAMLPRAYPLLEKFLAGLQSLARRNAALMDRIRIHFVGTGKSPDDPEGFNIRPYIEKHGLGRFVDEHPHRIPYLDVLSHLNRSSGVLVLGSTERHYTPSKVFQAVMSRRPVFAILHDSSSATEILRRGKAGSLVTFDDSSTISARDVATCFEQFVEEAAHYDPHRIDWEVFRRYSARQSASALARALDRALSEPVSAFQATAES